MYEKESLACRERDSGIYGKEKDLRQNIIVRRMIYLNDPAGTRTISECLLVIVRVVSVVVVVVTCSSPPS